MSRYAFYPARRKRGRRVQIFIVFITAMIALMCYSFYRIDKEIIPLVFTISDLNMTNKINYLISSSVQKTLLNRYLTAQDFYVKGTGEDGKLTNLDVNTVLVNEICSNAATEISKQLQSMEPEKVSLPLGSLSGVNFLANTGPKYTVTLLPVGNVTVDYRSSFESVGINQINFQVLLDVKCTIKIINPVQSDQVEVSRNISLVNTVISGEIPKAYLNGTANGR